MRLQVTLAEPDGMWSQPEGNATHGFYSSVEWKKANMKAKWLTKNVPGDGMCGWGAIMLIIGWLTLNDMVFSSKKELSWHRMDLQLLGWLTGVVLCSPPLGNF